MWRPGTKSTRIIKAVGSRILVYGSILFAAWWWMLWTPGNAGVPPVQALNADQLRLEEEARRDVGVLARDIGERNIPAHGEKLEEAAVFIADAFTAAGYRPLSQWYSIRGAKCRNVVAEIHGAMRNPEIVIVGAHYDSVAGSPGADDNASGVAVVLALARRLAATRPTRTLRFVAFANEEPPYFWTADMGSVVYAKKCHQDGDRVVAMLSIESVGFYSDSPRSQQYPAGLGLLYPSTGNFVAFVGNTLSRPLVHRALRSFRQTASLPSIGAAVPNAIPGAGWSDHWAFWQEGYRGIEVTDTAPYRNPFYHTGEDTADRVQYDRLARFAWGMETVVKQLAVL